MDWAEAPAAKATRRAAAAFILKYVVVEVAVVSVIKEMEYRNLETEMKDEKTMEVW